MGRIQLREGDGVLVLRLGAVGDVVRTLPCLARLRESLPGLRLGWVVESPSASLLPGLPWLDRIFIFPRAELGPGKMFRSPGAGIRSLRSFVSDLRLFDAYLALDFQGTAKSALLGALSGAHRRIGFDRSGSREWSHILSDWRVRPSSPRLNRVQKNLELLDPLDLPECPLRFPFSNPPHSAPVREFLATFGNKPRIAVHAGTSQKQGHKRWPEENYAHIVTLLSERGFAPILTWGPGEEDLVARIHQMSSGAGIPAPPTTLPEMRVLLAGCHLFVGGDTGPMHLAWSQGIPVVALFGATDPSINGPLGERYRILAPAWDQGPPFPVRGDPEAMRRIEPAQVLEAIHQILPPQERLDASGARS